MECIISEKGKSLIVISGYKFRFHKNLAKNVQRWACSKKSCKCFIKVDEFQNILPDVSGLTHNHEGEEEKAILKQKLNNTLKRKAVDDISSRPSKIIHSELRQHSSSQLTIQDVNLIRKNINHARLSIFPKLPKTISDFHDALDSMSVKTNNDENFVFRNSRSDNIVCFSTETNLKALCNVKLTFVDGTFYSAPKQFTQVFTIHGLQNHVYVPLVFFLLPNKGEKSYEKVLRYLIDICLEINLNFNPEYMYADFEVAIHLAIKKSSA